MSFCKLHLLTSKVKTYEMSVSTPWRQMGRSPNS